MENPTLEDLQSPDSKILYQLLSEKIDERVESLEEFMKDTTKALADDLSNVKDDVDMIASVFGFVRNGEGKLHRPI
ncbi:MAG: hypothetical protein OXN25_15060 [Candidatus Poribacteria bacterium]|nr:hypothetical protein [Candidatus Poribacteria bacterium]